jgi:signal transduction histidine kinase
MHQLANTDTRPANTDPGRPAPTHRLGIVADVIAVVMAMWADVAISNNQSNIDPLRRARTLRFGIAGVVIVVVMAMWAGVSISINQSRDTALKAMNSDAANLAFAFDEEVTHTLDIIAGVMDAVANRMAVKGSDMNIYAWSRQFPIVTGPIIEGGIIAPDGVLISGTKTPDLLPTDVNDYGQFRRQLDAKYRGLFIGTPVSSHVYNQMVIPISRRVESKDGRFIGTLIFLVSPAKLTSLYKSINLGDHGSITLVGNGGVVLARFSKSSPGGLDGIGQSSTNMVNPESIAEDGQGSYVAENPIDHITRLYSYRRGADYPLLISVGLDYDDGLALSRGHAKTMSALATIATLLLSGFALYLIREIGNRAKRDVELAAKSQKLELTNAELVESKERAEVANQAKSLFLANMSHELRTPLNAIIGFSQIIKDEIMGPVGKPLYVDYAKDICGAGEHLLEIISNLLDISKIEAGKTELADDLVDVTEIVNASFSAVRIQADKKRITLSADIPPGMPLIRGDATRLRQVLINILSNAVKFTPAGHVTVSLACDAARGFSLTVADTGIGMSPDEVTKALEPFGQIENAITKKYEGTGLGLPLAKRLVELHGGRLTVASAKDVGTTIRVLLPPDRLVLTVAEVTGFPATAAVVRRRA